MADAINIYCDESCHLEHDQVPIMALGAVWCPRRKSPEINDRLKEIKARFGLPSSHELKWTKISSHHWQPYLDAIDYFFDNDDLHFRGVVIPDKTLLAHERFNQTHDIWYYKMFFVLLKAILDPEFCYNILLDYKDTNGGERIAELHKVLRNSYYDFSNQIVRSVNLIRSDQNQIIQLTDLLTGALTYLHRDLSGNQGKEKLINRIRERSGYTLRHNTLYRESKLNLLVWHPSEGE